MAKTFNRVRPSLFEDLVAAQAISMESLYMGSPESYALILHLDNKTYYFDETGDLDGTSIDGPEVPIDWEDDD